MVYNPKTGYHETMVVAKQDDGSFHAKREKYQKFFTFARKLHAAVVDFGAHDSQDATFPSERIKKDNVQLYEATAVSSKVIRNGKHMPVLDLDIGHYYVESTTPGHAHLILGVELDWSKYTNLLETLADCGILQRGYVDASLRRGETWIRTPWTKKEDQ